MRTLTAILVLLAALVLVPAAQAQTPSYVQNGAAANFTTGTGNASVATTLGSSTPVNNVIVVAVDYDDTTNRTANAPTDDAGNTYHLYVGPNTCFGPSPYNYDAQTIFWAANTTAGVRTVTSTTTTSSGSEYHFMYVEELHNASTTSPFAGASFSCSSPTPVTNPSISLSLTTAPALVIGFDSTGTSTPSTSPGGWTQRYSAQIGGGPDGLPFAAEDAVESSTGTVNVPWTNASSQNHLMYALAVVSVASTPTYYIDYASGSNSNPGTEASPWKSSPGMQTGAGCAGSTHTYTHVNGDQFIFKGGSGETWPAACFLFDLNAAVGSGSSSAPSYIGTCVNNADFAALYPTKPLSANVSPCANRTSWPSTGWTPPLWDLNYTVTTYVLFADSGYTGYTTFDDIEVARQGISLTGANSNQQMFNCEGAASRCTGVIFENMNVHGWATANNVTTNSSWYSYGGFAGVGAPTPTNGIRLLYSTVQDSDGYFFVGGVKHNGGFGGACENCSEVGGNTFHDTTAVCFSPYLCHDNEAYNTDAVNIGLYDSNIHSQVIEDDGGGQSFDYNNYLHNNPSAVTMDVCPGSPVFNNVMTGSTNQQPLTIDSGFCSAITPSSATQVIYNNTIDGTATGSAIRICVRTTGQSCGVGNSIGKLIIQNNVLINGGVNVQGTVTTYTNTNNRAMATPEANQYGFVQAGKYSPSSADPNTVGQGLPLTSSCTGNLVPLCTDPSSAPWFGGSGKSRGSSWDIGAFQFQGGSVGPPTSAITSPTSGGTMSGSSYSLTATCTPQSPATVSSIQFSVDAFTFGAAGTMSPYTVTLDTTKLSNLSHTVSVVCTDSNGNTGPASVAATVSNSTPGAFTTDARASTNPSFIQVQPITAQTATFPFSFTITPNSTSTNDSVIGFGPTVPTTFSSLSILIRANGATNPGFFDAWNNVVGNYAAVNSIPYVAGTSYAIAGTATFTSGNLVSYNMTVNGTTLASGYTVRAAATSLGYFAGISDNGLYDTALVGSLQIGSTSTLSFSPGNLSFPNTVATMTSMLTDSVTVTNGPATIASAVVVGTGFSLDGSSTCTTSGSLSSACTYIVDFTPSAAGSYSGTLTVTGNQTGSPQVFNLTGTGVASSPSITCSPSSLNLGSVRLANPAITVFAGPIVCTITNPPATFTSVATSGGNAADFGVSANSCTGTVSASTCNITASFSPSLIGSEATTLVITATGVTGSPQNVALTGVGLIPAPPVAPSNSMFVWNQQICKSMAVQFNFQGQQRTELVNPCFDVECDLTYTFGATALAGGCSAQ